MEYNFKTVQEILWATGIGAGVVLLQLAVAFEPDTITDWKTWVVAGSAAVLRGAAGAALPVFLGLFKTQTYNENF